MKRTLTLAVIAAVALVAGRLLWPRPRPAAAEGETPRAPAFSLPRDGGGDVSLASLRGRVVAVNFWATWCEPCKAEMPDLAAVYEARRGKCLEVLGVAEESERAEAERGARALGVRYPILFDDDGKVGESFKIPGYPWTFLVDAQGRIRKTFRGSVTRAELETALAPLLAEVPASCPALARGVVAGAGPR